MRLFRRRKRSAVSPTQATPDPPASHVRTVLDDAPSLRDALRPADTPADAMRPGSGLLKLLPIGNLIDGIVSIFRDPNGKISSKRAGAGALVTAGIVMLMEAQTGLQFAGGCVCIAGSCILFYFTKMETIE